MFGRRNDSDDPECTSDLAEDAMGEDYFELRTTSISSSLQLSETDLEIVRAEVTK